MQMKKIVQIIFNLDDAKPLFKYRNFKINNIKNDPIIIPVSENISSKIAEEIIKRIDDI